MLGGKYFSFDSHFDFTYEAFCLNVIYPISCQIQFQIFSTHVFALLYVVRVLLDQIATIQIHADSPGLRSPSNLFNYISMPLPGQRGGLVIVPQWREGEVGTSILPNCDTLVHTVLIESYQRGSGASRNIIDGNSPSFIRGSHKFSPHDRINRNV